MLNLVYITQDMFGTQPQPEIKNIVYQLRKTKGITQEQLAESLNVTRQTVIAIEKGDYIPSLALAYKISKYFNLAIEMIFTYEE